MKTQLIMLDTPIIVSDEEIKAGDRAKIYWKGEFYSNMVASFTGVDFSGCQKIIAGIEGLPSIDWNGLEEEFGWIDVERLVENTIVSNHLDWIKGFKQAQSLNDKKFSLEDMEGFIDYMYSHKTAHKYKDGYGDFQAFTDLMRQYIQSLQQPKVFDIEVGMEVIPNYNNYGTGEIFHNNKKEIPKITNNSIKILRKL